jgi:hypothetical protein
MSDGFDRDGREWCHFGDKDPLWPGPLVFYSEEGHPWITTVARTQDDGGRKYMAINAITSMFARRLKKTKINTLNGTGFYTPRRPLGQDVSSRSRCLSAISIWG